MNQIQNRNFAIIPAAGHGRRMGGHKLLLPWNGATIIDSVLRAWTSSQVAKTVVVIRRDDVSLAKACKSWPVEIVRPDTDPRDMKESIQSALRHVSISERPNLSDRWLVAPADLPDLTEQLIDLIIHQSKNVPNESIIVPRFGQRTGHPVSFPWRMADDVFRLGINEGVDRLMTDNMKHYVDFDAEMRIEDIDTPEDYRKHIRRENG